MEILHLVIIDSDLPCKVTVHGHEVSREVCTALFNIPNTIDDCQLPKLLSQLDQLNICPGHRNEHFINMVKNKKGIILNSAGDVAAMSLRWIMVSTNYLKQ